MLSRVVVLLTSLTVALSLATLAVSATTISEVHWDPPDPTTEDKIRFYARVTDASGVKSVQLFHLLLRHFSPVGYMSRVENDIWALDIGPYDRNTIEVRLVVENQQEESVVSEVYTINLGKYRALLRRYSPWAILFVVAVISLWISRRLKRRRAV